MSSNDSNPNASLADALPSMLRQRLDSRNVKAAAAPEPPPQRPRERELRESGKENTRTATVQLAARPAPSASPSQCVREVERMRIRREAMREKVEEHRRARGSDDGTAEFQQMIADYRRKMPTSTASAPRAPAAPSPAQRIRVVVRKRPLLAHELDAAEYDTVTCAPDGKRIVVHEPRTKVDLAKCMESHLFDVDDVFSDEASTREVYERTTGALVSAMFDGCSATCFTYGQTGSGKTYTMLGRTAVDGATDAIVPKVLESPDDLGLYHLAAKDCFEQLELLRREGVSLYLGVAFFEVYCGGVFDLLRERRPCRVLEDAQGEVQVRDLEELVPESLTHLLEITARANGMRCVGTTSANEHSSRSHAVLQLTLRLAETGESYGRFSLVDLAGSERAADSADAKRTTRNEGAEINKSLLCLKECIRALGAGQAHTPFRGSKLTQVLRDAFTGESARSVMIANVSPGSHSVEHTLNTLRYAVRLSSYCGAASSSAPSASSASAPPVQTGAGAGGAAGAASHSHSRLGGGHGGPQTPRAAAAGSISPRPQPGTPGGQPGRGGLRRGNGATTPRGGGLGATAGFGAAAHEAAAGTAAHRSAGRVRRPPPARTPVRTASAPAELAVQSQLAAGAAGAAGAASEQQQPPPKRLSSAGRLGGGQSASAVGRLGFGPGGAGGAGPARPPRAQAAAGSASAPALGLGAAEAGSPGTSPSPPRAPPSREERKHGSSPPQSLLPGLSAQSRALLSASPARKASPAPQLSVALPPGSSPPPPPSFSSPPSAAVELGGSDSARRREASAAELTPRGDESGAVASADSPRAGALDAAASSARLERAVGLLTDVLQCAYEPETWREELALLGEEAESVAGVRAYAEHLDAVLGERVVLFDELRKQLRLFSRTLES